MKIAIASDIYYPMINGVAVFAHNLANGLARAGHEVIVIAPSFNGKYHVEIDPKTKVKTYLQQGFRSIQTKSIRCQIRKRYLVCRCRDWLIGTGSGGAWRHGVK